MRSNRRLAVAAAVLVAGCTGASSEPDPQPEPPRRHLRGTVYGLAGSGLVLHASLGEDLAVAADGPFAFTATGTDGTAYEVTVRAQPHAPEQTCTVTAGSGTFQGADAAVTVGCETNRYAVGGTVSGVLASGPILTNNGRDPVQPANGAFAFASRVASGEGYAVAVAWVPPTQACEVSNATGTIAAADVTSVAVACTCAAGLQNCDGIPANGCEVTTATDAANCGTCGRACSVPNGVGACVASECTLGACNPGYHACSGACASNASVETCGGSCTPCPVPANGTATCDGTSCGYTCNGGYAPCASGCCGTFTVSGAVTASVGMAVDGDLADPGAPVAHNDSFATAQALPSAVTVGGWAHASADPLDHYRVTLAAGQRVTLTIADPASAGSLDLDLCLYAVADTTTPVACSAGTTGLEQLDVTAAGDHYLVVEAVSGGSSYTLGVGAGGALAPALRSDAEFVPGEVLVQFRPPAPGVAAARPLAAAVEALGLRLVDGGWDRPALLALPPGGLAATALPAPEGPASPLASLDALAAERLETIRAVKALRARPDVESADPNYIHHPVLVPNDPHYGLQWHYPLINLPQAWDVTTGAPAGGGNDVLVAVADTGVFLAHPDFTGQLVAGYDFISSTAISNDGDGIDPNPDDPGDDVTPGQSSWHGTHVAGTVAARSNEAYGVAGVSWGAKIMPIRVLGIGGGTSADIVNGIRFAAGLSNASGTVPARRADVLNLSLGSNFSSATEQSAYTAVRNAGVIVVAAAGNANSGTPFYPASYSGVVSVSAVDLRREKAPYSNFGAFVDLAAPGGDTSIDRNGDGYADGVLSPLVSDTSGTRQPIWAFYQGTSMASPHVAGVVALMKAVCASLTPAQLDTIIAGGSMSVDLGAAGRDDVFGYGLVDARKAVEAAQGVCGGPPPTTLRVTPTRLDFAPGQTSATLTAAKVGTGALTVTGVADDASWLTVTGPGTGDGLGAYTVTVSAAGLPAGRYTATLTFTASSGPPVQVPVSFAASAPDAGRVHVLLLDASRTPVARASGVTAGGSYAFTFPGVTAGQYYLVAGSDHDGDGATCDAGEACGAWPSLGSPAAVDVAADLGGLDFPVGYLGSPAPAPAPYPLPARATGGAAR